ncbi:ParB/RepB/Spo0J family partition protein [Pseudomonas sp. LS-2]|uniref:ParB/RepB/Spo0J family partition protein n=1 Tax=Pseudomonas sp. LS-2 TaxID=2315859 RepID=UPI000E748795|nr:ParB/RepB/Spo0J family partition protein [Pseudomonas sp. LS-2]RJX82268.1 ParB/RepB/Spo0J family partition protein [Pseudomonas sp. LS-2]
MSQTTVQQSFELTASDIPPSELKIDFVFGSIKPAMAKGKDVSEKGLNATARDLWMPSVSELSKLRVMDGLNVRIKDDGLAKHIRDLADSMKSEGFKSSKPIEVFIVEENGSSIPYISDGHCRVEALKLALSEGAKIEQFPCVTLPTKGIGLEDIVAGLVTNNEGRRLSTFETALVAKRLFSYGWTAERIGERLHFVPEYVVQLLEVVSAPISIIEMLQKGELSVGLAFETLRKHRGDAVRVLTEGLATSQKKGKKKVTKADLAGGRLAKVVKSQSTPLYEAAQSIAKDPGFAQLSDESQALLNGVLEDIANREKAAEEKALRAEAKAAQNGLDGADSEEKNDEAE